MWEEVEEYLLKDKYIGPLIKKYGPCKIKPSRKKDYFVDLVSHLPITGMVTTETWSSRRSL